MSYAQRLQQGLDPCKSMANKGGGGGGSSVTVQEIPAELKPLANQYTASAINLANTPYQGFTGQRYADLNGIQNQAVSNVYQRAMNGSPLINTAQNTAQKTAQGDYLNPDTNPYLKGTVDRALGDVATKVNSQFSGSNYGTSANQEVLARSLGEQANSLYGQNYANERNNQMQSLGLSQQLGNQAYTDAAQLMNAGQTLQDQQQQGLDFNYQQYLDQQNLPYKNLAAMSGVFGSNLGGTSTTQQSSGGGK